MLRLPIPCWFSVRDQNGGTTLKALDKRGPMSADLHGALAA
jgi:hypothetical protein